MENKRFSAAVQKLAEQKLAHWYPALDLAAECDRLEGQLATDATDMSTRFTRWAELIKTGHYEDPPTGYSTLRDIDANGARFKAKTEDLITITRALGGNPAVEALRASLNEGR